MQGRAGVLQLDEQLQKAREEFPNLRPIQYGCEISFGVGRVYQILFPATYPQVPPMVTKGTERVNLPIIRTWNQYIQLVHVIRQLKTEIMKLDPNFCKQYSVPVDFQAFLRSQNPQDLSSDNRRQEIIQNHAKIAEMLHHRAELSSEKQTIREQIFDLQKQYDSDMSEIISLDENIFEMEKILSDQDGALSERMKESLIQNIERHNFEITEATNTLEGLKDKVSDGEISLDDYVTQGRALREQIHHKTQLMNFMTRKLHSM